MAEKNLTIKQQADGTYKEKGSKFLAYIHDVHTEEEVKDLIKAYRKEHHKAKHVCYAYRLGTDGQKFRAADDGEPSNTAGRPILRQLEGMACNDTLVVVVRYFGGTLLGTGGLVNAYKTATQTALKKSKKTL